MAFRQMFAHEWRLLRADRSVWVVLAMTTLLVAYGIFNGRSWTSFQQNAIAKALAEQETRITAMKSKLLSLESTNASFDPNYFRDPRNPRAVNSVYGYQWAVLPPAPLASLAVGQSDLYPYYTAVTAASRYTSTQLDELQNPMQLLAGRFDLAFVVIYLLPLLVFALSYNMIAEERENGTLSLVLAQPATLRSLLLAKSAMRILFIVGVAIALSAAGFASSGASFNDPGIPKALFAWTATVAAYGLFWLGLAALVNSLRWSSATNALSLAGIWLALVALFPSILNVAISSVHPLPSRIALVEAARTAQNRSLVRLNQKINSSGPIDMDQRARSSLIQILDTESEIQPILRQFDDQLAKQQEQVKRWRAISPAIITQLALTEVAGTDGTRYQDYVAATEAFRGRWREFLSPIYPRRFTSADVDRIPQFRFQDLGQTGSSLQAAALLLAAYLISTLVSARLVRTM